MKVEKVGGGLGPEFFGVPGTSHGPFQKSGAGQSVPFWAYVGFWGIHAPPMDQRAAGETSISRPRGVVGSRVPPEI